MTPDGTRVYAAGFHTGNQTTSIAEAVIPDGFGADGILGPTTNVDGDPAHEVGLIAKWTHPDDPSAGSAAIIVVALVPAGFLFGASWGAAIVVDRGRKPPVKRWSRIARADRESEQSKGKTPGNPGS